MAGMCLNFVGPDALIGLLGGSFHRKSFAAGDAAYGLRLRYTPPRSIGPLSPDPITGVNPSTRQIISGVQNLSGALNSRRATGPWVCKNYCYCGSTIAPGLAEQMLPVRFPP